MKKTLWFILAIVFWSPCLNAQVTPSLPSSPIAVDPSISPTAVEIGPHHRIWQTVTFDDQGGAITNSYTELATGLNFFNPATGQWEESQPQFKITENGYAAATNGQHQVVISPALNDANGAVTLQAPDGKRFRSTILGLNLYDRLTGKGLLIAQLTNSVGQLIAPNQVLFPDCFDTLNADVRLTYEKGQFHQDVIFHEGLDLKRLETLGFAADTSRLEIWTEFFESPDPTVRTRVMESETDPTGRAAMAEPDVVEEDLDFGVMKMPAGRAYVQEAARNFEQSVVVPKQWVRINQRKFLVESLSLDALKPLFATLPVSRSGLANLRTSLRNEKDYAQRQPPSPSLVQGTTNTILLAQGQRLGTPGVIWDYVTINGSLTNYTFKGDTTYYISGDVNLYGTTSLEGGTVIKSASSIGPSVFVNGPIDCQTSAFRPAVFTAKDDNSIGDTISGSTGSPVGTYAYVCLYIANPSAPVTLRYLRMAYALYGVGIDANSGHSVQHSQFVKVYTPLYAYSTGVSVQNALIHQATTAAMYGYLSTINAEHLTIHEANQVLDSGTLNLTNSLLVAITNSGTAFNGAFNATNSSGSVFATIGAGSHYLSDNTYRNVGTTNISANLRADLKKKTTFSPLVLTNDFTASTTLNPQTQRDTDTPDLGWHYDPLDYCWTGLNLTNSSTLTLTNGVVIGFYGNYGLYLRNGAVLVGEGSPANLNRLTRYHTVQEQPIAWGSAPLQMLNLPASYSTRPIVKLRFTDVPAMGYSSSNNRLLIQAPTSYLDTLVLVDCQLRGSGMIIDNYPDGASAVVVGLTNNVIERGYVNLARLSTTSTLTAYLRNNLFWRTTLYFRYWENAGGSNPAWVIRDNLFDNDTITEDGVNYSEYLQNSYNGYVNTSILAGSGGHDKSVTNFTYSTGALGPWYQSSTNMIDQGSLTNAALAGLYHYTTQTSQTKESNTALDIGFHYVAVDGNGNPLDYDTDGIPDYFEDRNGNGVTDAGETNWQDQNDLGLKVWITEPKNNSNIP